MSQQLRRGLPPLPERMARLPIDARGFPVPWFVAFVEGVPDHRVADASKRAMALRDHRCWICGGPLGRWSSFVLGPMCGVTRSTSEPPAHKECAEYSVRGCPFLSRPHAHRREAGRPEGAREPPGVMLERNPGVSGIWTCHSFAQFRVDRDVLLQVGEPDTATWWAEGRAATFGEFAASVLSGLPALVASTPMVAADHEAALREIRHLLVRFAATLGCTWERDDAGPVQFHEMMRDALAIAESTLARKATERAA